MKTIKLTLLNCLIILFLPTNGFSQQFSLESVARIGGTDDDRSHDMVIDNLGNIYIIGDFKGTVDFDPGQGIFEISSVADRDIFVLKLDPFGNFIWVNQIGGTGTDWGNSIAVDNVGNIYVTGSFAGTADLDPGTGTQLISSFGENDIYIQKLDASGNLIWFKQFGGIESDQGKSITVDESGNVYVGGLFSETVDFDPGTGINNLTSSGQEDLFIQKLDASGNLLWVKQKGTTGANDISYSIAIDGFENVYSTGYFSGNFLIQKYNTDGNLVWENNIGGSNNDHSYCLALDNSGNVYITGNFVGTVDFDPGANTFNLSTGNNSNSNAFLLKLNNSGDFVWAIQLGGPNSNESGYSITTDDQNNVYVAGIFYGETDFDLGPVLFNLSPVGSSDFFIQKLDSGGNFIWAEGIGGVGYDECTAILVDGNGTIYTTGFFKFSVDFKPGPDSHILTSEGDFDIFVHKMNQCTTSASIGTDDDTQICEGETVTLTASGGEDYYWSTGETTPSISVSPPVTTYYSVVTSDSTGCFGSATIQVTVEPPPYAQFDFTVNGNLVEFINLSNSNATDFLWDFGDNSPESIEENPIHFYNQPGVYLVTLVSTNPFCGSAISQDVAVLYTNIETNNINAKIKISPSPFQAQAIIQIEMPDAHEIKVEIYSMIGQLLESHQNESKPFHQIHFGDKLTSNGVYFVKVRIDDSIHTTQVLRWK